MGERKSRLTFVGTGEAFDPDLPNTSLLYEGDRTLLFDCGYAVPHALWRLMRDAERLDAIYVTHLHADHAWGLPALLLWMREEGRTRPLSILGGPGIGHWLQRLFDLAYPGAFDGRGYAIEPHELEPGAALELGALRLSCAQSRHPVRNLSVRVEEEERSFCYSGDGAPSLATRELYRGARVLVHECYAAERETAGHARLGELVPLALDAGVETLCLLHLSRTEKRAIRAATAALEGAPRVLLPAPGDVIEV
jgi:ribonuclease BN (tRNA processing enzyme)